MTMSGRGLSVVNRKSQKAAISSGICCNRLHVWLHLLQFVTIFV